MKQLPKYLGGHANITHLDLISIQYIKDKYNVKTAYDLGCGPGGMVDVMNNMGIDCIGIDGDFTLQHTCPIIIHDFYMGSLNVEQRDLCWSVEFLEHIPEQYMDNYFEVLKKCKYIMCTASQDNRPSKNYHHNVKLLPYWYNEFEKRNFKLSEEDTQWIRTNNGMKRKFITNTGMFWINNNI